MNHAYPLTVFFDASCGLCREEMMNIQLHDHRRRLLLVDCSGNGFDDTPYRAAGITRDAMMNCLHVRDSQGNWSLGVNAFELIYRAVGIEALATLWGGRYTRPLMKRLYPWVARHREALSLTGLPLLFVLWRKWQIWRINRRTHACKNGQCRL